MAVYLLHFDPPYKHAKHYLGFCDDENRDTQRAVESRLDFHLRGRGSKLVRAAVNAGCLVELVKIWPGASRDEERRMKGHSSTRYCPRCNGKNEPFQPEKELAQCQ